MGREKAIQSGEEHREPYRKSKAFDVTCRNHGSCCRCSRDRQFSKLKLREVDRLIEEDSADYDDSDWDKSAYYDKFDLDMN